MPTHPGPWQPAPSRTTYVLAPPGDGNGGLSPDEPYDNQVEAGPGSVDPTNFGDKWAELIEPPIAYGATPNHHGRIGRLYDDTGISGYVEQWWITQHTFDVELNGISTTFVPAEPWPVGAVGWEWEEPDPNPYGVFWLFNFDMKVSWQFRFRDYHSDPAEYLGATILPVTLIATAVPPDGLILDAGLNGQLPRHQAVPHSQLLTLPVIGSGSISDTVPDSAEFSTSEVSCLDFAASQDIPNGASTTVRVALSMAEMRSGDEPARNSDRDIYVETAGVTFTWQLPRYRFLYDRRPPLRQFPRDDALGGAPRQGHNSRSVQGSARQGWSGTYR